MQTDGYIKKVARKKKCVYYNKEAKRQQNDASDIDPFPPRKMLGYERRKETRCKDAGNKQEAKEKPAETAKIRMINHIRFARGGNRILNAAADENIYVRCARIYIYKCVCVCVCVYMNTL